MKAQDVIHFWFEESTPKQWFMKDPAFDEAIRQKFGQVHEAATRGELASWRDTLLGRLAEIIVLDQFSRNLYREDPRSFRYDGMALVLAQEALEIPGRQELTSAQRSFLYMPFMHSESQKIHEQAVELFQEPGLEENLEFEYKHKRIIDRFGRYPHRNEVLGRSSTPEELAFLEEPDSSF